MHCAVVGGRRTHARSLLVNTHVRSTIITLEGVRTYVVTCMLANH